MHTPGKRQAPLWCIFLFLAVLVARVGVAVVEGLKHRCSVSVFPHLRRFGLGKAEFLLLLIQFVCFSVLSPHIEGRRIEIRSRDVWF